MLESCLGSKIMKIGRNFFFFYFCSYVEINGTIGFSVKKYTTLVYLKVILGQTGQLGTLKTCLLVVPRGVKIQFLTSQPPRISQKRFEMHQGCVFFDAESNGTIYFGLSVKMTIRIEKFSTFADCSKPPRKVNNRL